ncbi:MAG: hypothetical protein JW730_17300, partial [Anaerolineales bacterium]|nr:hypothetical protein [Anaerolineales bacterium]
MNARLIVIDGKSYHSVDEMPPDIRRQYDQARRALGDAHENPVPDAFDVMNIFTDRDKNGVPDILEGRAAGDAMVSSLKIIVDGKEYNDIENLPPEARARYEAAMGKLDANRNGIPDFLEGMTNTTKQTANVSTGIGTERAPRPAPMPVSPTITPDTSKGWMLVLA